MRARFGRPARSQAGVAGGRCGRRKATLTSGPGVSVAERAARAARGDARSGPGRVRVRQAERARVEAGAGWAETEEGGEWAAARVGPTWAAEMGWWVWVLGSFPFLILFSLSSISNSNKI